MYNGDSLDGRVVVVTGASSGLGREAAVRFARKGCALVLAARRADALQETARLCHEAGARARFIVTDVTREADVQRLAEFALVRDGRIDVWVNNAGVTLFAALEESSFQEHKRVIETNLFGAMLGARSVVPVFRRQHSGVLINVSSLLGKVGQPFVPSYVISKFALRGLSETLRTELASEPDIHVCTLYPYAFVTQHFESGANRIGRAAHPMPPAQTPEDVAEALVDLVRRPRRERHVPRYAAAGLALHALFPEVVERLIQRSLERFHFGAEPEQSTTGNLFAPPKAAATVRGRREPVVTTPAFALWVLGELADMEFQSLRRASRRHLPRWRTRFTDEHGT
jgi:NAD(P)-dependent dehydrogenase (short-subunit alcohol dehydrogenase family)